jgi:tRNA-Thr(GGU) m(6)t(6)A37 methyltransferase TsaA
MILLRIGLPLHAILMSIMSFNIEAIGYLRLERPSKKYQLPRQPDFKDKACIELLPGYNFEQALFGLEGFSHIWVLFWMHEVKHYKPKVRPPGMEKKWGVLATRSPHRPNPIGLSCVKLLEYQGRKIWIEGCDMLENTPILDIKPYLAHQECYPQATKGWTLQKKQASVKWNPELYDLLLEQAKKDSYLDPQALERRLSADPEPSHYNRLKRIGVHFEIASGQWRFKGRCLQEDETLCFWVDSLEEA